jgi:anti-anti-sigma factor
MTYLLIESTNREGWQILRCIGAVDHSNFSDFETALINAALSSPAYIELDFELLKQMNSTSLGLMMATWRMVRQQGGDLRISRVSRSLKNTLDALNLSPHLRPGNDDVSW